MDEAFWEQVLERVLVFVSLKAAGAILRRRRGRPLT